jgi:hypothetical protein
MITPLPPEGVLPPPGKGVAPAGPGSDAFFALFLAGLAVPKPALPQGTLPQAPVANDSIQTPLAALPHAADLHNAFEPPAVRNFPGETFSLPAVPMAGSAGQSTGGHWPLSPDPAGQEPHASLGEFKEPTRRIELLLDPKAIFERLQSGQAVDLELPSTALPRPSAQTSERHVTAFPNTSDRVPQAHKLNHSGEGRLASTPVRESIQAIEQRWLEQDPLPTTATTPDSEAAPVQPVLPSLAGPEAKLQHSESRHGRLGSTPWPKDMTPVFKATAGIASGSPRAALEPLGIAVSHADPDSRPTNSAPKSRAQAALPPEAPVTKAALPPWSEPVKAAAEWIPSKPEARAETPVRFVIEDWNPDAPVRSLRITLEPKELGTIRIALVHRGGQVHARMVVDSAEALHLVQNQTQAMQSALAERGVSFGSFSLTVAAAATAAGLPAGPAPRAGLRADVEPESPAGDSDPEPGKEKAVAR